MTSRPRRARALRSGYEDLPPDARATLGTSSARIGDGFAIALTAIPIGMFNRVVGLGTARAAANEDVAAIVAFYEAAGIAQSVVQLAARRRRSHRSPSGWPRPATPRAAAG